MALKQINIAEAARQAQVPESTLRYDLHKVEQALPIVLVNQRPGPTPQRREAVEKPSHPAAAPGPYPGCGGKVRKNGTYWVLNWVLMLTMGWLGEQHSLVQRWRCQGCSLELGSPERSHQAEARQAWWPRKWSSSYSGQKQHHRQDP